MVCTHLDVFSHYCKTITLKNKLSFACGKIINWKKCTLLYWSLELIFTQSYFWVLVQKQWTFCVNMLCPCINVVTAYIRPKYRCLPGCLRGEKPPLATGNFSSPWVVLSSSALLLGLLLALLGLLRHMPLLAQQWGQVLAWGWFAPISASSLHYIPIPEVCERYSTDVQRTGRNSQDCSAPKY